MYSRCILLTCSVDCNYGSKTCFQVIHDALKFRSWKFDTECYLKVNIAVAFPLRIGEDQWLVRQKVSVYIRFKAI